LVPVPAARPAGTLVLPVAAIRPFRTAAARHGLGKVDLEAGKEVGPVKKPFILASAAAVAAVCVALLAGKDDIRRFWRIYNM
jgi:hypothetical protein